MPRYGEIAAAFFWSSADLDRASRPPVWPLAEEKANARGAPRASGNAGTGMGERTPHPVEWIPFHLDTGMYDPARWLVVRYALAGHAPWRPPPPRWTDPERPAFAPEMP